MEISHCINIIKELLQILNHANNSIASIEREDNLPVIKIKFEQLSRDVKRNINSLELYVPQIKTDFEKRVVMEGIDNLYDEFCKFDVDLLLSYLSKIGLNEKMLDFWDSSCLDKEREKESSNSQIPLTDITEQIKWKLFIPQIFRRLFGYNQQIEDTRKSLEDAKRRINNFMDITKEFRNEFKRILLVYDFIEEKLSVNDRIYLPLINDNEEINEDNLVDLGETGKNKPGAKEKIWMKGDLRQLSMRDVEILLNELYNKTNNLLFKDVEGIQRSKYNNIWASIVFYSAKTIGYVDPDDKPGQPYEKTMKKILSNVSRNTIADYYQCIDKFFSVENEEIRENMLQKYPSLNDLEIKLVINNLSNKLGISYSKCNFLCANNKRIEELIEVISLELEKFVQIELQKL